MNQMHYKDNVISVWFPVLKKLKNKPTDTEISLYASMLYAFHNFYTYLLLCQFAKWVKVNFIVSVTNLWARTHTNAREKYTGKSEENKRKYVSEHKEYF